MIFEFFIFGTLFFWFLIIAELGVLFYCSAKEDDRFIAPFSILVFFGILQLFSNINVAMWVLDHLFIVALGLVAYFIGGVGWIFPKWLLFTQNHYHRYLELRDKYLEQYGLKGSSIPEEHKERWKKYFEDSNMSYLRQESDKIEFKPHPRNHKARIMNWGITWPISLPWTMLNDPIRRFFNAVYYKIAGVLHRISIRQFSDVEKEME